MCFHEYLRCQWDLSGSSPEWPMVAPELDSANGFAVVPLWPLVVGTGIFAFGSRSRRAKRPSQCPTCAYDLCGLRGSRCPECGHDWLHPDYNFSTCRRPILTLLAHLILAAGIILAVLIPLSSRQHLGLRTPGPSQVSLGHGALWLSRGEPLTGDEAWVFECEPEWRSPHLSLDEWLSRNTWIESWEEALSDGEISAVTIFPLWLPSAGLGAFGLILRVAARRPPRAS